MQAAVVSIENLADYEAQSVTLKGWLYNKRGAKGLYFLVLRDGSGLVQCVVSRGACGELDSMLVSVACKPCVERAGERGKESFKWSMAIGQWLMSLPINQ